MKPSDVELRNQQRESAPLPLFEQTLSTHPREDRRSNSSSVAARKLDNMPPFKAHARRTDPATSKDAAAKLTNLGPVRDAIINALYTFGPQTDEGIAAIFKKWAAYPKCSPSGLRSRRAELVTLGFVEAAGGYNEDGTTWGEIGKTASGRNCTIWRLHK